jgi:hypothetical protein
MLNNWLLATEVKAAVLPAVSPRPLATGSRTLEIAVKEPERPTSRKSWPEWLGELRLSLLRFQPPRSK